MRATASSSGTLAVYREGATAKHVAIAVLGEQQLQAAMENRGMAPGLKQGCPVQESQMKDAQALANQAAMKAVVAVRLV